MARTQVQAAGGVVVRDRRVAVVHRPKYDDWSLPKGKLERGETSEDAALREVLEETGLHCRLLDELDSVEYIDPKGRPKRVRYWRMEPVDGDFTPTNEIDGLRWLTPEEASEELTYPHDRSLVAAALIPDG
jgi:8-oxo-dGTP diphosphatase